MSDTTYTAASTASNPGSYDTGFNDLVRRVEAQKVASDKAKAKDAEDRPALLIRSVFYQHTDSAGFLARLAVQTLRDAGYDV